MSPPTWTIASLLASMQSYFAARHIASARLDAEVLLTHVLRRDRIYLYTHFDEPLTDEARATLRELTRRRGAHEPVAYLVGRREFFSRDFEVNGDVLIPRPETEHVVEGALTWVRRRGLDAVRICDVGTGSGAIALTLAAELPQAQVVAVDVSAAALAVAARNAARLGVADRVALVQADVFDAPGAGAAALAGPFDVVVSNPPYIAADEMAQLPQTVRGFEPHVALAAGARGMDVLERLCRGLRGRLGADAFVAIEVGYGQAESVRALLQGQFARTALVPDLAGIERVVAAWTDGAFALGAVPFAGGPARRPNLSRSQVAAEPAQAFGPAGADASPELVDAADALGQARD